MGSNGGKKSKNRSVLSKKPPVLSMILRCFRKKSKKRKVQQTRMFTGLSGGELGIRTLGPFRDTAFRVLHLRPLGQLSICQSENRSQNFWKELTERTAKYSVFRTAGARRNTGFLADKTDTFSKIFESGPL